MSRPKIMSDNELLSQAFPVISKQGFDSFTLEQVAAVTGLAPATLIRRFKTKKRLAFLARDWKWNNILSSIEANEEKNEYFGLDGIFVLVKEIAKSVDSERLGEHLRLLAEDAEHPELKERASSYFQWTRSLLKKLLIQAIQNNQLNNQIEAEELSFHLEALIQGTIFQFAFLKEEDIEKQLIQRIDYALKPYKI